MLQIYKTNVCIETCLITNLKFYGLQLPRVCIKNFKQFNNIFF